MARILLPLELMLVSVERNMENFRKKKFEFELDAAALDVSKVFCLS
jgi:hypothetical protein